MSTSFVLHDLDGTPTPAIPGLGTASVIAECTIKDIDHPGPQVTHDGGWQSQRRAGTTPPGLRRRIVTKTIGLLIAADTAMELGALERFYTFVGTAIPFWLVLPADVVWPVPIHAGMVLPGGLLVTPGTYRPGDRVLLDDGEFVTFRSAFFEQPFSTGGVAYRRGPDADQQTQWRNVAMTIRLELPAEPG